MKFKDSMCKSQLSFHFVLLALLLTATQSGFAADPLSFSNNFFVTGDYIVAGAYNMNQKFTTINGNSYAVGTINVPDASPKGVANPGIQGPMSVPLGAQIVAALLYWQTVEKVGVAPGAPGSGQNGYFRPLLYQNNGGPAAPGYAISGANVSGSTTVSWSSGGCGGGSTGKVLRTYRADVAGGLPNDLNGNPTANGSFEVRLPSVGNATPLTLGATLVVIYRIPAGAGMPNVPLNAIVIYDGDYSQSNAQLTMTQPLQGFYDADQNPVSRLTHIVGSGQSNKFQTVYLQSGAGKLLPLPFLYGNKLPAFPGWYGTWDNTTWKFSNASTTSPGVLEDASTAATQVVPSMSNQGCVSWGAVIMSTTVKDTDGDGLLDSWENNKGYCDASISGGSCAGPGDPAWVDLTGADPNQKDVFLQYDYMCSSITSGVCATTGGAYSFDPRLAVDMEDSFSPHANAVDKVVAAYANHHITLHPIPGHAILEGQVNVGCKDTDTDASGNLTCPFPNEPGTVGFRYGLESIKNFSIETQTGVIGVCIPGKGDANCLPAVFQPGKKDSYHYALFSDGVGVPNWYLFDGSLSSVTQKSVTKTNTVLTFTTALPHGIKPIAGDTVCSAPNYGGRVTVVFALTNPNLNGTFCIQNVTANTFDITIPGSTNFTYTPQAEPYLAVADGQVTSMSGFSDVGGQNLVVALGYGGWGPANVPTSDGNKWQNKAGTFMHELGHNGGNTHGGTFYNKLSNTPIDYTPTYEVNCKSNVQTSMSYLFQFDLMQSGDTYTDGKPVMVVDYSEDGSAPTLTEGQTQGPNLLSLHYANTASFQLTSYAGVVLTLSSVANASGGSTVYTGTITGGGSNALAGITFTVAGFTKAANNGTFVATASTTTTVTLSNASGVSEVHAATAGTAAASLHCDGTPLLPTDPLMTYVQFSPTSDFFLSPASGSDINFNGSATDVMHSHDEWDGTPAVQGVVGPSPGLDLRQISAIGTLSTSGAGGGHLSGGSGGGHLSGGSGGGHISGGSGGGHISGGSGGRSEFNHEAANSYARPPRGLVIVQEEASPRHVELRWFEPTFGTVVTYNVKRSDNGNPFHVIATVTPPTTSYEDKTDTCGNGPYRYEVTAVIKNDAGVSLESSPTNIVPAATEPPLTGCYTVTGFSSSPSSARQGSPVSVMWTLQDDWYTTPPAAWAQAVQTNPVTNTAASTLVAVGPNPNTSCTTGRTTLLFNGQPQLINGIVAGAFSNGGSNVFTFALNTDVLCAGSYSFELDLDSGQTPVPQPALQLGIDVTDNDGPAIVTTLLPDANVGASYSNTVSQDGGVGTIVWSSTGLLPPGISLNSGTGILSGTPTVGGIFTFTVTATDSNSNTGSQTLTLRVLRDVIVVDGTVAAQAGTLLRVSPGTTPTTSTLASLSNGQPSAVAMDRATGNIYAAVANGTARIVRVSSAAVLTDPFVSGVSGGGVLTNPVGVAVDSSDNLYVGDNSLHAIYKFDSTGAQVDASGNPTGSAFATLPSPTSANNIRMTFDSAGNLIVASDSIGGTGVVEVDLIPTSGAGAGTRTVLYNTSTMAGTGPAIVSVGGIAVLSDGSIAVADNMAHAIYKIANPGTGAMAISAAIAGTGAATDALCCNITGMTNPPSAMDTTLYVTVNGVTGTGGARVVLAVPETNSVSTLFSGSPLTSPNDITWFRRQVTYYVDGNGNFGTLDPPSATVNVIGRATVSTAGVDVTPNGQVYVYDFSNQLMQVNTLTGTTTAVGSPGTFPNPLVTTIAALTDGSFFGVDAVNGNLYSINLITGATTVVGPTATLTKPQGCGSHTSMAGSASVLYYTAGFGGPNCSTPVPDTLYQINPANGSTTTIGTTSVTGFIGSGFVGGKLYGFTGNGNEYVIDPATGTATLVGNTNAPIFGAGATSFIF